MKRFQDVSEDDTLGNKINSNASTSKGKKTFCFCLLCKCLSVWDDYFSDKINVGASFYWYHPILKTFSIKKGVFIRINLLYKYQ